MLVTLTSMKSFANSHLVPAIERPQVAPGEAGGWVYTDTGIPAVGARDISLGEAVNPREIVRSGEKPEAILLSLTEIESDRRLHWVLEAGTRLNGGDEPEYKVSWAAWQEHAAEPVGVWLPEWDGAGLDRSMALSERHYRFAKQAMDDAGVLRQYLVVLAARLGRSRRIVAEKLGLSTARIQQLNETASDEIVADVDEFVTAAARVAALLGREGSPRADLLRPRDVGADEFEEIIGSMIATGLAEERAEGLRLTDDGLSLVEMKVKRKPVDSDVDRERAGNATR
jgi:hypothetical protein